MDERRLTGESSHLQLSQLFKCSRVLCLVDSISEPEQAVGVAKSLAAWGEGICEVVMCLDAPGRTQPGKGGAGGHAPLTPEVIGQAECKLSELYGEEVSSMVLPGHPVTEIRRYARNKGADMIVIGEQGLALERKYDERICDDAPCTVMMLVFPKVKANPSDRGRDGTLRRIEPER